jgi:hypothetical protein
MLLEIQGLPPSESLGNDKVNVSQQSSCYGDRPTSGTALFRASHIRFEAPILVFFYYYS